MDRRDLLKGILATAGTVLATRVGTAQEKVKVALPVINPSVENVKAERQANSVVVSTTTEIPSEMPVSLTNGQYLLMEGRGEGILYGDTVAVDNNGYLVKLRSQDAPRVTPDKIGRPETIPLGVAVQSSGNSTWWVQLYGNTFV